MKETPIRSFIAIPLPISAQHTIAEWVEQLKQRQKTGVRWVHPANLHLTLKFLGDISPAQIPDIQREMQAAAAELCVFTFDLKNIGAFPGLYKPRVIWVGIQAPPALKELHHSLDHRLKSLNFPLEERPFSAHLTLGRISRKAGESDIASLTALLRQPHHNTLTGIPVQTLHLYRSELSPQGPRYTLLYRAFLKNADEQAKPE